MLAISDNLTVFVAVFQLVFSAVVSITLWRLTAWQRRYEGLEDRLHEATTRLVDERFRDDLSSFTALNMATQLVSFTVL